MDRRPQLLAIEQNRDGQDVQPGSGCLENGINNVPSEAAATFKGVLAEAAKTPVSGEADPVGG